MCTNIIPYSKPLYHTLVEIFHRVTVSVLEDELNVLGSIVDEVSKKIALLSGHLQHGGGRKYLELDGVDGVSGGGDGCVGYVKRLFDPVYSLNWLLIIKKQAQEYSKKFLEKFSSLLPESQT